jgi:hypothetical protein
MDKAFIARPSNTRKYHIFGENKISLCQKILLLFPNEDLCSEYTGKEKYKEGDCKACFKKAGLLR